MSIAENWIQNAAQDIVRLAPLMLAGSEIRVQRIIGDHCPLKYGTAYVEVLRLTPSEKRMLSIAAVAASSETAALLGMIERLTGHDIVPADEVR